MLITKAFQAKLCSNVHQQTWFTQQFGNICFTWNYFLSRLRPQYKLLWQYFKVEQGIRELNRERCKRAYESLPEILRFPRRYGMYNALLNLKHHDICLEKSGSRSLQVELGYSHQAYKEFFKHICNDPKFKSKKYFEQSYTLPNIPVQTKIEHYLQLTKLGYIKAYLNMHQVGKIKRATVTLVSNGDYCMSPTVQCESQSLPKTHYTTSIDVGLDNLAILFGFRYYAKVSERCKHVWRRKLARRYRQAIASIKYDEHLQKQMSNHHVKLLSQVCHTCGMNTGKKPLDVRNLCPYCHTKQDRNVNAANVLRLGLKQVMDNSWLFTGTSLKSVKCCEPPAFLESSTECRVRYSTL